MFFSLEVTGSLHSLEKIKSEELFLSCALLRASRQAVRKATFGSLLNRFEFFPEITITLLHAHFPFVTQNVEKMYSRVEN